MSEPTPRVIRVAHALPGRLRLRLPWLYRQPQHAEPLAERLAALHPSMEVEVQAWTGSVLCRYDPGGLDVEAILAAARGETGVTVVLQPGERAPAPARPDVEADEPVGESRLHRSLAEGMRELNRNLMRSTGGTLDLGAVAGLGFLALGAAEILSTRRIPAPPWFNLAWWSFRTFTLFGNSDEHVHAAAGVPGPAPAAEVSDA